MTHGGDLTVPITLYAIHTGSVICHDSTGRTEQHLLLCITIIVIRSIATGHTAMDAIATMEGIGTEAAAIAMMAIAAHARALTIAAVAIRIQGTATMQILRNPVTGSVLMKRTALLIKRVN
jgi:hypothetical protein